MAKRPTAVTFLGWYGIFGGILGMILAWPIARRGPEWFEDLAKGPFWDLPPIFLFLYAFLASVLFLIFGVGLLNGRNWARFLFLALCLGAILVSLFLYDLTPLFWLNLILNLAFTVVVWFFLYRPKSNAFFREPGGLDAQGNAL